MSFKLENQDPEFEIFSFTQDPIYPMTSHQYKSKPVATLISNCPPFLGPPPPAPTQHQRHSGVVMVIPLGDLRFVLWLHRLWLTLNGSYVKVNRSWHRHFNILIWPIRCVLSISTCVHRGHTRRDTKKRANTIRLCSGRVFCMRVFKNANFWQEYK